MTSTTTSTTSSNNSNSNGSVASATNNLDQEITTNSIEAEYKKIADRQGWHRLYQEIRDQSDHEAHVKQYGTSESEKPQNRCLNRYRDVNPYDHSRIIIHRGTVDYINANLVKLERADRKYILTQGPLKDTVGHFWLMIWEQNTRAILMLNKLVEKKQNKCDLYWPDRKGAENALKLDEVKLMVEFLICEEYKNFCRRLFKLTDLESNQSREIVQFHYTTWPDFGIPTSPVAFLQFLKQVRDSGALDPDVGPAVVHCSAGIGRSGTFCLVDCCLVLIDKEGEHKVSVKDVLHEMRRYRMGLIQTADQLYFSYQAIIEGIKLLKDPNFLNYTEAPFICIEDQPRNEHFNMDETPPPLPPRTHSLLPLAGCSLSGTLTLNLRAAQGKPLPNIPASESFNDDLYVSDSTITNTQMHQYTDALNNFINNERLPDNMSNRPLPPLPTSQEQVLLDRVHESESDENDLYEEDDSDDIDIDDDVDDDDTEGDSYDENIDDNVSADEQNANNKNNTKNAIHDSKNSTGEEQNESADGEVFDMKLTNGIESGSINNRNITSPDNELKRRARAERQATIEQKVNEIKRKQREAEEGKQAAKKRRSLITYIAAGVVVGVICVYAYSKFT